MTDVPTYLHQCYDITTPSGSGGNPFKAKERSEVFNAGMAFVHSGMKDLGDKSQLQHDLLMFFHTTPSELQDKYYRYQIVKEMVEYFWRQVDSKGMHKETIEKIPKLCDIVLSYSKAHITGAEKQTKEAIAAYLGIQQTDWYKSDRHWNNWFGMLINNLKEIENKGLDHMYYHLQDMHKEKARIKVISKNATQALAALA